VIERAIPLPLRISAHAIQRAQQRVLAPGASTQAVIAYVREALAHGRQVRPRSAVSRVHKILTHGTTESRYFQHKDGVVVLEGGIVPTVIFYTPSFWELYVD